MAKILETKRLILQELTTGDAPFIIDLLNSPGFIKYIGDRGIRNVSDAENYLVNGPLRSYREHGFGLWLFSLKNGTPVGICGLLKREGLQDIDIGFAMMPEFEKNGYGFEIAAATIFHGKTVLKIDRIVAITVENNFRSIRLLESVGLKFEKRIRLGEDKEELLLFGN